MLADTRELHILENDNTKPFARMGRKAYRVSQRQPGRRNIQEISGPGFFVPSDSYPLARPDIADHDDSRTQGYILR